MPHPPIHQWTHDGDRVLLVKMIGKDRKTGNVSRNDGTLSPTIDWPESGIVACSDWDAAPICGGGIHAWPWGMFIGDGKDPDATAPWLVLAAKPEDLVQIEGGKVKARAVEIVHSGTFASCMYHTQAGRIAWIIGNSAGSAASSHCYLAKLTER